MRKPAVLCVGRLYCDLIFTGAPRLPSLGTEVFAQALSLHAGGGAFITAAYLSALGQDVHLAATLPADPFTGIVDKDIETAGVGSRFCGAADAGCEPQITVAMTGQDDRAFLTRRVGPAFPAFDAAALRAVDVGHLHIGELGTLAEHPELLAIAKTAGATVSLDCGWDDAVTTGVQELIGAVDIFLPNEVEIARLLAMGIPEFPAPLTVIKSGAKGARAIMDGRVVTAPARKVEVVDTTGAGDAFNSGFLDAWLQGMALETCLAQGNACGASAVQNRGGLGGMVGLSPGQGAGQDAQLRARAK